jgi:hypothetical protein
MFTATGTAMAESNASVTSKPASVSTEARETLVVVLACWPTPPMAVLPVESDVPVVADGRPTMRKAMPTTRQSTARALPAGERTMVAVVMHYSLAGIRKLAVKHPKRDLPTRLLTME